MKAVTGKRLAKLAEQKGWRLARVNGSHHVYVMDGRIERLVIPIHGSQTLKIGLQRSLMKLVPLLDEESDTFFPLSSISFSPPAWNLLGWVSMKIYSEPKPLSGKALTAEIDIRSLPKVLLHEHLDGGLRPETVIELAKELGYGKLPTTDPTDLAKWFHRGAQRGNLPEYLEGFQHTIAVMQTPEALERVAFEFIEDMYFDGVVYAEVRFAPIYHTERGLTQDEVVAAVVAGLERGERTYSVEWGLIICAMRHMQNSLEAAELAIRSRELGVVGFDLAGGEDGFPPKKHVEAFQAIERANFYITIHAGEAYGPESIWQALQYCGAHRLGHATRLRDDITLQPDGSLKLGPLAQYILDRRVPMEMCLLSNLHTGASASLEDHPFGMFFRRGFRVCLNTDDRLMSDTTMTQETTLATEIFDLNLNELEKLSLNAMKSAFAPYDKRIRIIFETIKPAFTTVRATLGQAAGLTGRV